MDFILFIFKWILFVTNVSSFKSFTTPYNLKQPYNKKPCVITDTRFKQLL